MPIASQNAITKNDEAATFWVFAYGSLMWNPGFEYLTSCPAILDGYRRDMCILSHIYRGTPECPGLVMGLRQGGQCVGRAFEVAEQVRKPVMAYLEDREMFDRVYEPRQVSLRLTDSRCVQAHTFIALDDHPQYVGHHSIEQKAAYVLQGHGQNGSALEYMENCRAHLQDLSITDDLMEDLWQVLLQKKAQNG